MASLKFFYFVFLLVSIKGLAQTDDLVGAWKLVKKTSLSGIDYSNGVPVQIKISKITDSIFINRLYDSGGNGDYTIVESLPLDGKPMTVVRESGIKRVSTYKPGNDVTSFAIEVTYRDINSGKQTSSDFIEKWSLLGLGKELLIEKNAKDADGSTWSMKAQYQLKSEAEAATGKGIRFIESVNWGQVKAQAKNENKYIFVDCFATWCVPCKQMEKEIFALNTVGTQMNDRFICVRLQMDTTPKDNDHVKRWFAVAHKFLQEFNLIGYPSYLFFDANGNIVHKAFGFYNADEFIELMKDAQDPRKQYYTLLKKFKSGEREYGNMDYLALSAKKMRETPVAEAILNDYRKNHLAKLPLDSLLTEKYLKLAGEFEDLLIRSDGSKGSFFKLFRQKGKDVDRILNAPGFSTFHVNGIITNEEIESKIYKNGKPVESPTWGKIKSAIAAKYNKLMGEKLVLDAQIQYYQKIKDWKRQIKYVVEKADKYGALSLGNSDGSGSDNIIAAALLLYCEDKRILNKAISWMEQIINGDAYKYPIAMVYGNYGGILYKAGRRMEGIAAFKKHLDAIGYKTPVDLDKDPRFKPKVETLEKMKRGEEIDGTWKITSFF